MRVEGSTHSQPESPVRVPSLESFERWFGGPLRCRLVLFRYSNIDKNPLEVRSWPARLSFQPSRNSTNPVNSASPASWDRQSPVAISILATVSE